MEIQFWGHIKCCIFMASHQHYTGRTDNPFGRHRDAWSSVEENEGKEWKTVYYDCIQFLVVVAAVEQ